MACRQHVSRSIGQEGRGQRGSGFRQTGAQGILQVVDNQVCVFGSRAPMADIGGWRTVSSVQRLSAGTFRAPVWRNCRHCRRRRSRRRQALPLMSRSLRSFDFRLLNRNAPDVPWDGTAGAKNGEIAPGVPFLGTSGAIAMSDAPRGGVLRAAGVGYACVGCAGVRCSARTSAKSLTGTGEKRPKVFRQRGQAVMICSGLLAVRLSMAPRVMGSRSS